MATTVEDIIERLRQELDEATEELNEIADEASHPPEAELGGGSSGYSTWQTAVVLRQHVVHRIEEIEAALDRAEKGLYGVCEVCGDPIPVARLEAMPYTTHCVKCAAKAQ